MIDIALSLVGLENILRRHAMQLRHANQKVK
jgi:hypothetical protein